MPPKTDLELEAHRIDSPHQKIQDKIRAALKLLTFREKHVLVQFWCPHEVGKSLATLDQPFGLGVIDERLWLYRQDSERHSIVVDKDNEEVYRSPAARVFRRGLSEWTFDLDSYTPQHFPQQECAISCNLHGYLGLPVFDSSTRLCVGVLELLTSARYTSYAYEVQRIHDALETVDLTTQQAFDSPILNVPNERRRKDFSKIYTILKTLCDIHTIPLAQTWAVSQHCCFVSHERVIEKSCSSFATRCIGKVCMSRNALPFHIQDMRKWPFFKASREQHLDRSCGLVGRALLSRGSSFCGDVTKLSEEEYPLVHNARMNRLTSCFAIFLHSVEADDDYVLEFFLTPDIKESRHVLNLIQTLKQNIETASGFELGDSSYIQVVEPRMEVGVPLHINPGTIQISSPKTTVNNILVMGASGSVSMVENAATTESASVTNQRPSKQKYPDKFTDIITDTKNLNRDDVTRHGFNVIGTTKNDNMISYPDVSGQKTSNNVIDAGEQSNCLKPGIKRKIDSLRMEAIEKHVTRSIDQAVNNLGGKVKRWSCSSRSHGFSGKWWSCGKHSQLPFRSYVIYQTTLLIMQLRRWRNRSSKRNARHNIDHPAVSECTAKPTYTEDMINIYSHVAESNLVHASPKQTLTNISDTKNVTVKATFRDDMIKFKFPTSSGLLELEHEVARRIKLKSKRICLKYMDEEKDLILLACDADLDNLLRHTANDSTIKLLIQMADY
ncbi:hypothetical protein E3N88_42051 [Mikania micrantha]|uniref:PB1 domain-containing protein n=1 Tax=Mikania micrantha TaxID=192012 RepID=A0A5N6LIV3_9ASTR|nr:hypothetical protein E3N88_42051 [Mikania micrantha]